MSTATYWVAAVPVESNCLIIRYRVYLFHFPRGNWIWYELYPFSALKIQIKILKSFLYGAIIYTKIESAHRNFYKTVPYISAIFDSE